MSNPTSDQSKSPFPSVRRVVTGHTPSGEAIVLRDEVIKPEFWAPESRDAVHNVYQSDETPARNDAEVNKGEEGGWVDVIGSRTGPEFLVSKGGSTIRSFDLAPGSVSPFHRTHSLDYGILVKGTVILELDNGKRITLNESDTVVQRGTIHAWRNESTEWARIYFVVLDAQPVAVNGETLPTEFKPPAK